MKKRLTLYRLPPHFMNHGLTLRRQYMKLPLAGTAEIKTLSRPLIGFAQDAKPQRNQKPKTTLTANLANYANFKGFAISNAPPMVRPKRCIAQN
jgi:hypothetical protein